MEGPLPIAKASCDYGWSVIPLQFLSSYAWSKNYSVCEQAKVQI